MRWINILVAKIEQNFFLYKKKRKNSRRNIKVKMKDSVIQIYSK